MAEIWFSSPGNGLTMACLHSLCLFEKHGNWVTTLILAFTTQISQNDCVVHMLCGNRVPLSKTVSITVWAQWEGVLSRILNPRFVCRMLHSACSSSWAEDGLHGDLYANQGMKTPPSVLFITQHSVQFSDYKATDGTWEILVPFCLLIRDPRHRGWG